MLKLKDVRHLETLLYEAFVWQEEISPENIEAAIQYILIDASNIWKQYDTTCCPDMLIYSSIELCLYREGFSKTAKRFRENTEKQSKRFFEKLKETTK